MGKNEAFRDNPMMRDPVASTYVSNINIKAEYQEEQARLTSPKKRPPTWLHLMRTNHCALNQCRDHIPPSEAQRRASKSQPVFFTPVASETIEAEQPKKDVLVDQDLVFFLSLDLKVVFANPVKTTNMSLAPETRNPES